MPFLLTGWETICWAFQLALHLRYLWAFLCLPGHNRSFWKAENQIESLCVWERGRTWIRTKPKVATCTFKRGVCDAIYTKGYRHFFFLRMFNLKFSLMYSSLPHSSGTWAAGFHCDLGLWLSGLLWSWRRRRRTSKLRCHMVYFLKKEPD